MEYDVIILINNNKDNGTLTFNNQQITLKVKEKCRNIYLKDILAIKQIDYNSFSILLSNKQVIIIQSKKDINLSNIFLKWKSHNDSTIKINSSIFKSVYTYSHPLTALLVMLIVFILVYDGLIGVSLSNSLEINPIAAFFSGMVFGFAEYPIDFIQIVLFSSLFICIVLEFIFQHKWIKEIEMILNNHQLPKVEHFNNDYSELEKLKELLDKNIITEEDFNVKKRQILNLDKDDK